MQVWNTWGKVPGVDQSSFKDLYKDSLFEKQPTLLAKLPDREKFPKDAMPDISTDTVVSDMETKVGNVSIDTGNVKVPDSPFAPLQKLGESMPGRNVITKKDADDPFYWMVVWPS